jgi:hypothetical protein
MRSGALRCVSFSALVLSAVIQGTAQQIPAAPATNDPRVGLKPGLHDAGEAARNMERISNLPKPEGFFDPKAPAGNPAPPERAADAPNGAPAAPGGEPAAAAGTPAAPGAPRTG